MQKNLSKRIKLFVDTHNKSNKNKKRKKLEFNKTNLSIVSKKDNL